MQPWSKVTLQTGNTRQIGQIHAPDLLRCKHRDQQKRNNKQQKQCSRHDMWNTLPRQQDERKRRYFGGIPKIRRCLLFVLWPWWKQEKSSLFFRWSSQWQRFRSDGQHPRLGARCKACSDTCWRNHWKSVSDFYNWHFALVWTSKWILNKIKITNLYYKLSFTLMLQFTQLYISDNYGDRYHLFS